MRNQSLKFRKRAREAKPVRDALVEEFGECMNCGSSPTRRRHPVEELNELHCHEIANGPDRQKALDKPFSLLVLCNHCNGLFTDKGEYPVVRQLALLKRKAPHHYNLREFCLLLNENAPLRYEEHEVDEWLK